MEHLFAPYKIAVRLKELGFDEPCFGWYSNIEIGTLRMFRTRHFNGTNYNGIESCYLAPLYQQVINWFKEKHGLIICEEPTGGYKIWQTYDNGKKAISGIYNKTLDGIINDALDCFLYNEKK